MTGRSWSGGSVRSGHCTSSADCLRGETYIQTLYIVVNCYCVSHMPMNKSWLRVAVSSQSLSSCCTYNLIVFYCKPVH